MEQGAEKVFKSDALAALPLPLPIPLPLPLPLPETFHSFIGSARQRSLTACLSWTLGWTLVLLCLCMCFVSGGVGTRMSSSMRRVRVAIPFSSSFLEESKIQKQRQLNHLSKNPRLKQTDAVNGVTQEFPVSSREVHTTCYKEAVINFGMSRSQHLFIQKNFKR